MKYKIFIGILLLTGCGVEIRQKKPLEVAVTHTIQLKDIEYYFDVACRRDYADPEQIEQCVADGVIDFMEVLGLIKGDENE